MVKVGKDVTYHVSYEVAVEDIQIFKIWQVGYDSQKVRTGECMISTQGEPFEKAEAWSQG